MDKFQQPPLAVGVLDSIPKLMVPARVYLGLVIVQDVAVIFEDSSAAGLTFLCGVPHDHTEIVDEGGELVACTADKVCGQRRSGDPDGKGWRGDNAVAPRVQNQQARRRDQIADCVRAPVGACDECHVRRKQDERWNEKFRRE